MTANGPVAPMAPIAAMASGGSSSSRASVKAARARPTLPLVVEGWALARARVNIALIKYWGKAPAPTPDDANLPAVPSLSLTLDGLYSETAARFAPELETDRVVLDGVELEGAERARALLLLDAARRHHDVVSPFEIISKNTVPTAAGLASSASGMAAMAVAVGRLIGFDPRESEASNTLSELARIGSGSASRSIFGGWVAWDGRSARPVLSRHDGPDVVVVIAVVTRDRKPIGSRDGMTLTQKTSPFFAGWVEQSHATFHEALDALQSHDLPRLFSAMELSTWRMHASAMGASPPVCYWLPTSLAVLGEVEQMKRDGLVCGATLDAGPNVKVFCRSSDAAAVSLRLTTVPGVAHTIQAAPGDGAVCVVSNLEEPSLPQSPMSDPPGSPTNHAGPDAAEAKSLRDQLASLLASAPPTPGGAA